jgi:hypothetical protein
MDDNASLALFLGEEFGLQAGAQSSFEELERVLSQYINSLIRDHFERLVNLLYRIDVDEARLRHTLDSNPGLDAGGLIARLILDRQLQKIAGRKKTSGDPGNIPDEERW